MQISEFKYLKLEFLNYKNLKSRYLLLALVAVYFQMNCVDTTVDPFEKTEEFFSVYGVFDLADSINTIRVRDIKTPLLEDSTEIEPIEIIFTDVSNNFSYQLDPKAVNFNGNFTLNYSIDYPIQPNTNYQLTITDLEGNRASVSAKTPGITIPSVDTLGIDNFDPLSSGNTECNTEHNFVFSNVKEGEKVIMFSGISYQNRILWARTGTVDEPTRIADSDTLTALLSVRQLLFDHFPLSDQSFVNINPRFWPSTVNCSDLDSNEILIRYFHFSSDWEEIAEDEINVDNIFEIGAVENGIGFIGGMNSEQFKYRFFSPRFISSKGM